jgi:hypothetical protein
MGHLKITVNQQMYFQTPKNLPNKNQNMKTKGTDSPKAHLKSSQPRKPNGQKNNCPRWNNHT